MKAWGNRSSSISRGMVVLAAVLVLCAVSAPFLWRATSPAPPTIDTTNFDPAVTALIEEAQKAVRASPRSAEKWGRLGAILLAHELWAPAAQSLAVAEKTDPHNVRWPYLLGHALRIDDPRAAAEAFERALQAKPDDCHVRLRLGETLLELGRTSEAQTHFQAAFAREPNNPVAALDVARAAIATEHWKDALAALAKAVDRPGTRRSALRLLVLVQQQLGDVAAAAAAARSLESIPEDQAPADPLLDEVRSYKTGERAWLDRVDRLNAAQRFSEALALTEKLARDYPDSTRVWLYLGTARARGGQRDDAEGAYRRSIALSPDFLEANNQLGVLLAGSGRHAEAIQCYQRVLKTKPNLGEAWFNLGLSLGELRRTEEAESAFRSALRHKPNLNAARIALALVLERRGQIAEAAATLQEARVQDPSDERVVKALRRVESER